MVALLGWGINCAETNVPTATRSRGGDTDPRWRRQRLVAALLLLAALAAACRSAPSVQPPPERGPVLSLTASALSARVRDNPGDVTALCDLAVLHWTRRDLAGAVQYYEHAIESDPSALRPRFWLAAVQREIGLYSEAIAQLQQVVEASPRLAEGHARLGVLYAQRAPAADDSPGSLDYRDLELAVEHCRRSVQLAPDVPEYQANLGRVFELASEIDSARSAFSRALELDPSSPLALARIGELELQAGDVAAALRHLEAATRLDTTDADLFYQLGRARERAGQVPAAIRALERSTRIDGTHRRAWYQLGLLLQSQGHSDRAEAALSRFEVLEEAGDSPLRRARMLVQRRPDRVQERMGLAAALRDAGDVSQALHELAIAAALDPANGAVPYEAALLHDRQGQLGAALGALAQAVALAPDSAHYHLRYAQARAKASPDTSAAASFRQAARLRPGWPKPLVELGMLYLRAREPERAAGAFQEVLARSASHTDALFGMALADLDLGRPAEAAAHLRRLLAEDPAYPRAVVLLTRVQRQL